ncbi:type II toxin-antitoxin system RelE/ParE family toxin [Candidatus Woesearchaeota archaeon]|nr:type II toxin-antitoxin system RelE/ParE family toxin [Candidatus Woesearchaeota archaeon]
MYSLEFTETAQKQFAKLERLVQERITRVLERICTRPQSYLVRLVGEPLYKLRVGDYRLIISMDEGRLILLVIKVGHRKNVYN